MQHVGTTDPAPTVAGAVAEDGGVK
jgi:hypothetical protein